MRTAVFILDFVLVVFAIVVAIINPYAHGSSQFANASTYFASAITLIFFILRDATKAYERKAQWIPGQALVLSAFTIQLLSVINDRANVSNSRHKCQNEDLSVDILLNNQMIIDSGRLVVCVFIAYLLPGLACSREGFMWGNIGALMMNVLINMIKHLSIATSERPNTIWFVISNTTVFTSIILLLLLLSCAVLAGKSIDKIVSQKIPLALSCCSNSFEERDCKKIEDHVLKCWIVVRACQPDYIIARSVLSSLVGLVVTACVLILSVKFIFFHLHYFNKLDRVKKTMLVIEFLFALIGWIIVLLRWVTAVVYFPRNHKVPCGESIVEPLFQTEDFWTRIVEPLFQTEDFWTRSIVDNRDDLVVKSTRQWFSWKKRQDKKLGSEEMNRERTPNSGLDPVTFLTMFMRLWLQKILVFLSKTCWFLSEMAFGNKVFCRRLIDREEKILSSMDTSSANQFHKYKNALECIRMPRERASSLWIANEKAFQHTQKSVDIAIEIGKSKCTELTSYIRENRLSNGCVEDEAVTLLEEEKCFLYIRRKSWKRTAVSLIHFIIYFYNGNDSIDVDKAIEAYSQAWDLLDFVDSSNPEAKIVSDSADKDFNNLVNIWKNYLQRKLLFPNVHPFVDELLVRKIRKPLERCREKPSHNDLHDSRDWMTVASKISLYKRWKIIDRDSTISPTMDKNKMLKQMLAKVIAHCIEIELPKALIENCNKWTLDWEEAKIYKAAFIAGKASGLSNQNGEGDGEGGDAENDRAAVDEESQIEGRGNDTPVEVETTEEILSSSPDRTRLLVRVMGGPAETSKVDFATEPSDDLNPQASRRDSANL